jgi:hypothetical protein
MTGTGTGRLRGCIACHGQARPTKKSASVDLCLGVSVLDRRQLEKSRTILKLKFYLGLIKIFESKKRQSEHFPIEIS